jgi:hypothetical protein
MDDYAKDLFRQAEKVPTNVMLRVLKERLTAGVINGEGHLRDIAKEFTKAADLVAKRKKAVGDRRQDDTHVFSIAGKE